MVNTPGSISGENISLSFNFSNKILLISSIILFHFIPFLINRDFFKDIIKISNTDLLIVSLFFIFLLYFFDYQIYYTGGGIFFQISNFFLKNNILFYIISFISLILIFSFSKNIFNNVLIFSLLVISNIQNTIYHKYYDPLLLILFFTLISTPYNLKFFDRKKNILFVYVFYIIYIFSRIIKNSFIT